MYHIVKTSKHPPIPVKKKLFWSIQQKTNCKHSILVNRSKWNTNQFWLSAILWCLLPTAFKDDVFSGGVFVLEELLLPPITPSALTPAPLMAPANGWSDGHASDAEAACNESPPCDSPGCDSLLLPCNTVSAIGGECWFICCWDVGDPDFFLL